MAKLVRIRKKGEQGFYSEDRDVLKVSPGLIVQAALFVEQPNSAAHVWLKKTSPESLTRIKVTLKAILDVLNEGSKDYATAIAETESDHMAYSAICMALGSITIKYFEEIAKLHRVREVQNGNLLESHLKFSVASLMHTYDVGLERVRKTV